MANYTEVMREWKRMCTSMEQGYGDNCCENCPVPGTGCPAIWEDGAADDSEVIERVVMKWAEAHPEPKTPTWRQWLLDMGLLKMRHIGPEEGRETLVDWEMVLEHMPTDIADKLGVLDK